MPIFEYKCEKCELISERLFIGSELRKEEIVCDSCLSSALICISNTHWTKDGVLLNGKQYKGLEKSAPNKSYVPDPYLT